MAGAGDALVGRLVVRGLVGVADRVRRVAGQDLDVGFLDDFVAFFAVGEDGGTGAFGAGRHRVHAHGDVVQLFFGLELGGGLEVV